jgi:septum formation protein
MLEAAGLSFEVDAPRVDEEAAKASLRAGGLKPRDQADALAELKALSVSRTRPDFVIGADQMLAVGGDVFDKPKNVDEARQHLTRSARSNARADHRRCRRPRRRDHLAAYRYAEAQDARVQ